MSEALLEHATQTIAVGSKSFAAAARLFDPATRRSVLMLYAWCRHCDDTVDGQTLGFGQMRMDRAEGERRLQQLHNDTERAYAGLPMESPAFAAFQEVALRHTIPQRYAAEHLAGFAMDVEEHEYRNLEDTLRYCYYVAGVVGIMMALIMGAEDAPTLDRACDLGLAFQLTNIARDVVEDASVGRCYLPQTWLDAEALPRTELALPHHREKLARLAGRLVDLADAYYTSALDGLPALPWRSAWAIATARSVYRHIGVKVQARGVNAWDRRVSTSTAEKLWRVAQGVGTATVSRVRTPTARPGFLWQRPR